MRHTMRHTLFSSAAAIALAFGATAATAQGTAEPRRGDAQSQPTQTDQTQPNQPPQSTRQSQKIPSEQPGDQSNRQAGQNQQDAPSRQQTDPARGSTPGQSQQGAREPTPAPSQQGAQAPQQTSPAQGDIQGQSQQGAREPAPAQRQQGAQAPQQTAPAPGGTPVQGQQGTRDPAPGQGREGAQAPQQGQSQQGAQLPRRGNQESPIAAGPSSQPDASGRIEVSEQQQTRINAVLRGQRIEPVTKLDFAVSVGSTVPSSVRLTSMPTELADVLPPYRSYSFFVAQREVVIVDPQSFRIVAFVPLSSGGTVGMASPRDTTDTVAPPDSPPRTRATRTERKRVTTDEKPMLTDHEGHADRREVDRHRSADRETDVTVGSSRSEPVEVEELPSKSRRTVTRTYTVRRYRYVEPEDRGPEERSVFPLFDIFRFR
jgi:hypothetical protein